jgi:hypothetical protein
MQVRHWLGFTAFALVGLLVGVGPAGAGELVISEFLASNDGGLTDEDGDYSDWIEIHNTGGTSVNLAGWYLTDDPTDLTKWQFPSAALPGGGYLVVFASDKNRTASGGALHTSFKLSADGEYLGLIRPDGVTVASAFAPAYPPQYPDVSYGVHVAAGYWYLDPPTPGAANTTSAAYSGVSADIAWSHPGGTFLAPQTLELSGPPAGSIHFTLDGTLPSEDSPVYTGPITLDGTTWVRARACAPGLLPGPVVSRVYLALAADVADFTSNLPLVVVDTFGFNIDSESDPAQPRPSRPAMAAFIETAATGRSALDGPADYSGYAGIHVRGHSSTMFEKKQYKLETWDEYAEDLDAPVLGFPADSDWVLSASYSDKSLMRNLLAYKWSNDMGRYAVRTRCVEVFMNTDGNEVSASDYAGVYILMENIKRGDQRVNIAELNSGDNAEPEVTGGYIIKKDRLDLGESGFWTMAIGQLAYVEPAEDEITPQQATWLSNWVAEFENVLFSANFADPVNGYAQYIDVDSFIDYHILVEMFKNVDGYRLSTFMFKDRDGKLNMGPAWDYDLTIGNADYREWGIYTYPMATGWYYASNVGESYNWYTRLMQDPEFVRRYADRWFALRNGVLSTQHILADINGYAALLAEAAARNFNRWQLYVNVNTGHTGDAGTHVWTSILNAWVWPNWYYGTPNNPHTYAMEVEWLKTWLTGNGAAPGDYSNRLWWFDHHLASNPPPVFNQDGGRVDSGFVLTLQNAAGTSGTVYYTLDGSDPRVSTQPSATVLIPESMAKRAWVPTAAASAWNGLAFNDSAWPSGSRGVGFERSPGDAVNFTNLIGLDVDSAMYGANASCYIRVPFTMDSANLAALASLSLDVRYDDAFVAYLNGHEIARSAFVPSALAWNSAATNYREDSLAVTLESFDVSAGLGYLVAGNNVLAIQGLNNSTTSSDFLVSVELTGAAAPNGISPTALNYDVTGPITLTSSVDVRARSLAGNSWSAVHEAQFTVGPIILFINEFMADNATTVQDPDEAGEYPDWVELYNPGPFAVDLGGMYLTDDLTKPTLSPIPTGVSIDAGETLVFWADGEPGQGPLHANFKLSKGGEAIGLFDTAEFNHAAIDAIVFAAQTTDVSEGRWPDGAGCRSFFDAPTPGVSNGLLFDGEPDGDIDLDDLSALTACLGGPSIDAGAGCIRFDSDCDGDVDLLDFAGFQAALRDAGD